MTKLTTRLRIARPRVLASAILALFAMFLLGGCVAINVVPPGTFDDVDKAVEKLRLETVGDLQADGRYGGGWAVGDGPTYKALVVGNDAVAEIEERLGGLGYSQTGGDAGRSVWIRGALLVVVSEIEKGDKFRVSSGETVIAEGRAAVLVVTGSNE